MPCDYHRENDVSSDVRKLRNFDYKSIIEVPQLSRCFGDLTHRWFTPSKVDLRFNLISNQAESPKTIRMCLSSEKMDFRGVC